MNRKQTPDIMSSLLTDKPKEKTAPKLKEQTKTNREESPVQTPPKLDKTKATFYISNHLLTNLENLWLDLRRENLKYSKGDIVEVDWTDACSNTGSCRVESYDPDCVLNTVGRFVKRQGGYFVMASQHDRYSVGERDYRMWMSIPTVNLKKVVKLKGGSR